MRSRIERKHAGLKRGRPMNCPKCEQEQPDGAVECSKCGVIFAKWQKAQERPAAKPASPRPSSGPVPAPVQKSGRDTSRILKIAMKIVAAICIGGVWYWYLFTAPSGLPVPENAYEDANHSFALLQPQGWKLTALKDCTSSGAAFGTTKDVCNVLSLELDRGAGSSRPNLQVIVAPVSSVFRTGWGGSAHISERNMDEIAEVIGKGVAGRIPGFEVESSELIPVDNLNAVKVVGSARLEGAPMQIGDKVVMVPFGSDTPAIEMTMGGAVFAGGSTAYIVTFGSEKADYGYVGKVFDEVMESFRVTERHPTPFQKNGGVWGNILGDAILGALVGLTIALFKLP